MTFPSHPRWASRWNLAESGLGRSLAQSARMRRAVLLLILAGVFGSGCEYEHECPDGLLPDGRNEDGYKEICLAGGSPTGNLHETELHLSWGMSPLDCENVGLATIDIRIPNDQSLIVPTRQEPCDLGQTDFLLYAEANAWHSLSAVGRNTDGEQVAAYSTTFRFEPGTDEAALDFAFPWE